MRGPPRRDAYKPRRRLATRPIEPQASRILTSSVIRWDFGVKVMEQPVTHAISLTQATIKAIRGSDVVSDSKRALPPKSDRTKVAPGATYANFA